LFVCRFDALLESATAGDASGAFTSYEGLILVRTRNLPLSLYFSFFCVSAILLFSIISFSVFSLHLCGTCWEGDIISKVGNGIADRQ
jgi:hypothetical protein